VTRPHPRPGSVLTAATNLSQSLVIGLLLCASTGFSTPLTAHAQDEPAPVLDSPGSSFNLSTIQSLLERGDAAAASGDLVEARRLYDQARDASRRLISFYRDISGAFRGLDARIPREMDDKGRQALNLLTETNLRLAALFRRQNQPEVAVPLLVEVVRTMTPANESGRRAYQQLIELGFVTTPYTAPGDLSGN
jgi:hypothetical protein